MSKMRKLIVLTIIGLAVLVVLDNAQVEEQTRSQELVESVVKSTGHHIASTEVMKERKDT